METTNKRFIPLEPIHPSDVIKDELVARGMRKKELAERLGMKAPNLSRFFSSKEAVTPNMALKLEEAFGLPADYWMRLQVSYERDLEAIRQRDEEESKAAKVEAALSSALNLKILFRKLSLDSYKFINDKVKTLYNLFHVESMEDLLTLSTAQGCFKKSERLETENKNLSTWILLARHACLSSTQRLADYSRGNEDEAAREIAAKANSQDLTENDIKEILSRNGIGYSVVEKFEKTPVDAYSVMIEGHPYVVVSHRRNNMDILAFDVLHECGHISKHFSNDMSIISFNQNLTDARGIELEANRYAMDMLIPSNVWAEMMRNGSSSIDIYSLYKVVTKEGKKHGISPSIASWRFKYETGVYKIKGYKSKPIR